MARTLGKLQRFLATLLIGHIYRTRLSRSAKAEWAVPPTFWGREAIPLSIISASHHFTGYFPL